MSLKRRRIHHDSFFERAADLARTLHTQYTGTNLDAREESVQTVMKNLADALDKCIENRKTTNPAKCPTCGSEFKVHW
jgi:UDP-N-acetylenolpyruvoylglucosamine reductase